MESEGLACVGMEYESFRGLASNEYEPSEMGDSAGAEGFDDERSALIRGQPSPAPKETRRQAAAKRRTSAPGALNGDNFGCQREIPFGYR